MNSINPFEIQAIKQRKVFVNTGTGQRVMPEDYKLTKKELNLGSFARTAWGIGIYGKPIVNLTEEESQESSYMMSWDTEITDKQAFKSIRDFYNQIKEHFKNNYTQSKIKPKTGVNISKKDKEKIVTLETFLNEEDFQKEFDKAHPELVRVTTDYVHIGYAPQKSPIVSPGVLDHILVASRLDLSAYLPKFVMDTHRRRYPTDLIEPLSEELENILR